MWTDFLTVLANMHTATVFALIATFCIGFVLGAMTSGPPCDGSCVPCDDESIPDNRFPHACFNRHARVPLAVFRATDDV